MLFERIPKTSEEWYEFIIQNSTDRCDLDILLKDEWRHKIVIRDDAQSLYPTKQCETVIKGGDYAHLKAILRDNETISLRALAVTAFHCVLGVYGHGSQTVIALLDVGEQYNLQTAKLFPVFVDHTQQSVLSCIAALEKMEGLLQQSCAFVDQDALVQRCLFDAALVTTSRDFGRPDKLIFPLAAFVFDNEAAGCLKWTISYADELFENRVITGLLDVVQEVFLQMAFHLNKPMEDVELVSEDQRKQLLKWNDTDGDFPATLRLNDLVEIATKRTTDFEALVFKDKSLTYSQLNAHANQFAHWLRGPAALVQSNELIALYLDKSDSVVVTILGIWKTGAGFVPMDPNYPADRVRFIVEDSGAKYIITNRHHSKQLRKILEPTKSYVQIIDVETVLQSQLDEEYYPKNKLDLKLDSMGLAYVTYTSGTTGVPKGVPKVHRSVVNSITDLSMRYNMLNSGTERVALFSAYVFEPFLRQMLIALINSQTLVIVPDDVRSDLDRFPEFLKHHKITYLNGTGSVLQHFDLNDLVHLKRLLLVGEELTTAGLRQLRERFKGEIINEYAFTETAFVTTIKQFAPSEVERTDRSIGRPLRNVKCYVLSQSLKQVPIGAIGELYIGGMGVADGYINRDDLTKERFLCNPFQTEEEKRLSKNARIYKTGDLARVLPNGEFEYMGRSDFQLKLNGIRVEPGEIEARAMAFPGVRKCVVVTRDRGDGDRYLVGYFVAEEKVTVAEADLLAYLEERLIRVMVPARMVQLQSIPVNINGKVDWRALPDVPALTITTSLRSEKSAVVALQTFDTPSQPNLINTLRHLWGDVLGIPVCQIGEDSDFFRLGGHSISCILLIARIRKKLSRSLDVGDVFKLRTLANLAHHLEQQNLQTSAHIPLPLHMKEQEPGQPVSLLANGLHQGLLYHTLKTNTADDAYIMQSVYRYRSKIYPNLLKQAWQHMLRKYPGLRLRFEWGEEPLQIIDNEGKPLNWHFEDLSAEDNSEAQEARIKELQLSDRIKPYKMAEGPLFRVYLIKQRDDQFTLIFSCHHIILDGWSLLILHDDMHRIYLCLIEGSAVEPQEDTTYIEVQQYWANHLNDSVGYWLEQIERIGERCDLAGLLKAEKRYKVDLTNYDQILEHKEKKLCLGIERTSALKSLCADNHLTLHSVLQFVWHKVLNAIGGGQSTVVGTIVSGRNLPIDGIEQSIGLFINTLPLIVDHDAQEDKRVAAAIADIQSAVNAMNSRSILELGRLKNGAMKRRLFDTLLVLENYPRLMDEEEAQRHKKLLPFELIFNADKVDHPLALVAREEHGELVVNLWHAGELFDEIAIDTLLDAVETLFGQLTADMSMPVRNLKLCSERMLARFDKWNCTESTFNEKMTLHEIFEQVATRWPDSVAVVFEDVELSYVELEHQANQLAHQLLATTSLHPNELIALVLDKSEKMIIAILAVWKSGAAYVPIDPGFPDERIAFMLEDTQTRIILTNTAHSARMRSLVGSSPPIVEIETLVLDAQPHVTPITSVSSTDLAYAIYTSGTTGKPKAVLVEHRGVVNLQTSLAQIFSLSKDEGSEALLSFSNYVFDHFVEQMTDALLNGQKLVVLNDDMRADQARLLAYIAKHGVTYLSGTPSVLSLYDFSKAWSLTRIDAIGEDFTEPVFNKIRGTFKGTIINGYGPTEVSITTHKRLYGPGELRLNKSIGYPVANTKCYVLNRSMKRVPIGGIGELYIGGIGVARGYLNRDDLTMERFLSNSFQAEAEARVGSNARIYKTGDLVRWLPNGELEYLGRTDLQVKIRGHRIELGEIEAVLTSYAGVSRSFIIAREHRSHDSSVAPQKYLVGFYLSDQDLDEQTVKRWMRTKLAEALVPARILRIENIPVTANGKLDVQKLPDTDFFLSAGVDYTAPTSSNEIKLCGIWSKVLDIAVDRISVHDDFFGLGGDSIRAISLAQSAKNTFGRRFLVSAVFKHVTIAEQARYIQQLMEERGVEPFSELGNFASVNAGFIPVSLAQQRLIFINDFEGDSAAYNISFFLEIDQYIATLQDSLKHALRRLLCRHPALHTVLKKAQNGKRMQQVLDEAEALTLFQITEGTVKDQAELDKILIDGAGYIFRLNEDLPIRVGLFRRLNAPEKTYLNIIVHHSCFDGWSWNIFQQELAMLSSGVPEAELGKLEMSYADFAIWQRQQLSGKTLLQLAEFWKKFLAGSEPAWLPQDWPRPARFDYRGREIDFRVPADITKALKALARSSRVSLYSVLLGAYCLMLNTFTGQHDLIIGTPSANRGRPEFNGVIGFFANLLALRVRIDHTATIRGYIRSVGKAVIEAQIHNEMPFEELIRCLKIENDPSRNPIVQIIFTLQDTFALKERAAVATQRLSMTPYKPNNDGWTMTKFDVTVTLTEGGDGLIGNFTYAASLFSQSSAHQFLSTFQHMLGEFARLSPFGDVSRIADICLADPQQIQWLLKERGEQEQSLSVDAAQPIHHVFERIAARWPDSVAVVFEDIQISYLELDHQANQLAHHLLATTSLRPNNLVALVLDKSEKMIIAILAVWKSGAAYVPVDPSFPDERIAFMLEDTQARIILTNTAHSARMRSLTGSSQPIVEIETLVLDTQPHAAPVTSVSGIDLAYAIYTSGTTGKPKAVLVEHQNLYSFLEGIKSRYFQTGTKQREGVLLLSNYVFDFSIEQIALSILSGNRLIIPLPALSFQDDAFYELMNREKLTYLSGTPTQVHHIDLSRLKHLRTILVAGELFQSHHFKKITRTYCGQLYCAYGTTETTVYNTVIRFNLDEEHHNTLGTPLSNTRLYVLNDRLQLLPNGAIGELYLAGRCVARGYLNQQRLTSERFLANPYQLEGDRSSEIFAVIYKTGDLVRRRSDGHIEYIGRNDVQVKINGVRIEPAEIEAALANYPGVKQCAVLARSDSNTLDSMRLIGYFVTEEGVYLEEDKVLAFLKRRLMPNMVPSQLVHIDGPLPMTINGKLDTRALPQVSLFQKHVTYVPPRSRLDAVLCDLWRSQLVNAEIGIDDNFFRSGGDSIKAMILASEVQKELGRHVSVKHLFDFPSVREFVDNVVNAYASDMGHQNDTHIMGAQKPLSGICPMLPIQEWFFSMPLTCREHWNQHFALRTPPLDTDKLREALRKLVDHHDAFRLRYRVSGIVGLKQVQQFYSMTPQELVLHIFDISGLFDKDIQNQLQMRQSAFDLEQGPTWCAVYLYGFNDGSARVWFAMHHLIVDTVSWQILARDLEIVYHGGDLESKNCNYRQWVEAVQNYVPAPGERQLWEDLATAVTADTIGDFYRSTDRFQTHHEHFQLSTTETQALLTDCHRAYDTHINDLLLTAVGFALRAITRQSTNYITLESHGRSLFEDAPEVRDTMGWFTTMYPFAVEVLDDLEHSILGIKSNHTRVPHQGIGYGALRGVYGSKAAPLPPISFNYLGQLSGRESLQDTAQRTAWHLDPIMCGSSKGASNEDTNQFSVDITMSCVGGHMVVEIDNRLEHETAEQLACELKASLKKIVAHTLAVVMQYTKREPKRSPFPNQTLDDFEPYILANEETTGPILFVLPPGEGGAESYLNNIVKHLHDTQLVLFNNIHLFRPMDSFKSLARYYIEHVKRLQPNGPYHFLGWSFGGVLALEIALQLAKTGEKIENLILIDSYFDVRHASGSIGLQDVDNILDPINYHYSPSADDLEKLNAFTNNVWLFKAGKMNDFFRGENQKLLFNYYKESQFNNLDRLLPTASISLEMLSDDTHHSWVQNEAQVIELSWRISAALHSTEYCTDPSILNKFGDSILTQC